VKRNSERLREVEGVESRAREMLRLSLGEDTATRPQPEDEDRRLKALNNGFYCLYSFNFDIQLTKIIKINVIHIQKL
jgi:hypothetical protein